jgi:hypothetical protein
MNPLSTTFIQGASVPQFHGYWVEDPFTGEKIGFNKNQFGFDRGTIEAFTEGDCWRLAFDLHDKLGYSVFVVTDLEMALNDRPSMYFGHMFVQNPSTGKFIDVNGEHTEDEILNAGFVEDLDIPTICDVTDDLHIDQASEPLFYDYDSETVADKIINYLNLIASLSSDSDLTLV